MNNRNRDLLVLLKTTALSGEAFEKHVDCLHDVLMQVECNDVFCNAHEMVTRLRITSSRKTILKAISGAQLKPFCFLMNKN